MTQTSVLDLVQHSPQSINDFKPEEKVVLRKFVLEDKVSWEKKKK